MYLGNPLIRIPAILIAITFHEYAHGKMADSLGDRTARMQGRLTLNPLEHLDPIGLLMLWLAGFGWAKPVPVNPMNFKGDKAQGMILVAAAGPGINLLLAFVSLILQFVFSYVIYNDILFQLAQSLVWYNIILAIFNLMPVPPLDGSKIVAGILPYRYRHYYQQLEQFGPFLLIFLILAGAFRFVLMPLALMIHNVMAFIISSFLGVFL